jgi:hypothetical protein
MINISSVIKSVENWASQEKAIEFAQLLSEEIYILKPERFDRCEPAHYAFNRENLTKIFELWTPKTGGVILKRKAPHEAFILVDFCYKESKRFETLSLGFDEKYIKEGRGLEQILSSIIKLYKWGMPAHGYICHNEDWTRKNQYYTEGVNDILGRPMPQWGGNQLQKGLPGIYWANLFGPIYVKFFGRERFLSVPAYYKEELSDGGFLILTSETPFDYKEKKVQYMEKEIIEHLGKDAFFENSNPVKICNTPQFEFKQEALGRSIEVSANDEVKYAIPDPYKFINKMPDIIKMLEMKMKNKLDYTFSSLNHIDKMIYKKSEHNSQPWIDEEGAQLIQELTAYYGEVFRTFVNGKWAVRNGSDGDPHPVIIFNMKNRECIEYPFVRVIKYWTERDISDALSAKFHVAIKGF